MRDTIDTCKAEDMHKRGMPWREIGIILAREDGRELPYLAVIVWGAVRLMTKRERQHADDTT